MNVFWELSRYKHRNGAYSNLSWIFQWHWMVYYGPFRVITMYHPGRYVQRRTKSRRLSSDIRVDRCQCQTCCQMDWAQQRTSENHWVKLTGIKREWMNSNGGEIYCGKRVGNIWTPNLYEYCYFMLLPHGNYPFPIEAAIIKGGYTTETGGTVWEGLCSQSTYWDDLLCFLQHQNPTWNLRDRGNINRGGWG